MQAIRSTRPGGHLGYVGVTHDELFFSHVRLHGGPAPVRRFLPKQVELIANGAIQLGKVFDLTLPLDDVKTPPRDLTRRSGRNTPPGSSAVWRICSVSWNDPGLRSCCRSSGRASRWSCLPTSSMPLIGSSPSPT